MFDKLKQKEQLIDKLQAKNVSLKAAIVKKETQIKHKNEMGEELKFIDFHQLQIENKKHVKDIDDRNNKLLILKVSSANTVASLQELKDQLAAAEKRAAEIEKSFQACLAQKTKQLSDIEKTEQKVLDLKNNIKKQEAIIVKYKDEHTDPIMFIDSSADYMKLKKMHKNWSRKIEIAELEGKKARSILKKHGIPWHDEPMDEEQPDQA